MHNNTAKTLLADSFPRLYPLQRLQTIKQAEVVVNILLEDCNFAVMHHDLVLCLKELNGPKMLDVAFEELFKRYEEAGWPELLNPSFVTSDGRSNPYFSIVCAFDILQLLVHDAKKLQSFLRGRKLNAKEFSFNARERTRRDELISPITTLFSIINVPLLLSAVENWLGLLLQKKRYHTARTIMIDRLNLKGDPNIRTTSKKVEVAMTVTYTLHVLSLLAEAWWIGFVRPTSEEIRQRVLPLYQKYFGSNRE